MHRSASESAEEKKGVIIEAEVRYVFRIPLVKIEFELIIEAEVTIGEAASKGYSSACRTVYLYVMYEYIGPIC